MTQRAITVAAPRLHVGRRFMLLLSGFVFSCILVARQPDVLLNAQFWAEDGGNWYPQAYESGWRSMVWPWSGYLQSLSRLVALAVQPFPLLWAPTLFALAALAVQVAPALFLVSDRMDGPWPSRPGRAMFAVAYLTLQNSGEVYVNLTNAQWHLALLAFLVVAGDPPSSRPGRAFDAAVLALSGLSGPFCLCLLPVAAWAALRLRGRSRQERALVVLATVLIQGAFVLETAATGRIPQHLGASALLLARIVALQVAVGALMGEHTIGWLVTWAPWWSPFVPSAIAAAWLVLTIVSLWRGSPLLRQATFFFYAVFAAALWHPNVSPVVPQWEGMIWPGLGVRYYVFPMIAFLGTLFTLASDRAPAARTAGLALLVLLAAEVPFDWRPNQLWPPEEHWDVTDFDEQARWFQAAPSGTLVSLGTHPNGQRMVLRKH